MEEKRKVLNLGSASWDMNAGYYDDFEVVSFDIDPERGADITGDAKELKELEAGQFDAVHVSHLLEHFYEHENQVVLEGIYHVLKDDGMVDIYVPNIMKAAGKAIYYGVDANIYNSDAGTISFHQMLYGLGTNEFMAHHQGFDVRRLSRVVGKVFPFIMELFRGNFEVGVVAFKQEPTWQKALFAKEND